MIKEFNNLYKEKADKVHLTLYTPTFNRSKCLESVYDDLLNQTSSDFVWIIVNDGSKDNTDEIARNLMSKNELPICLISKPNGGKHSAFKVALEECKTPYFQCLDDDDRYLPKAVARFLQEWETIDDSGVDDIGAIRCLVKRSNGSYVGNLTPKHFGENYYFDLSTLDLKYKWKLQSENWTCYRTDALRSIDLFSSDYWLHDKHKFFSEGIWQGRFARKYKCRYIIDVLREFSTEQAVSLTRSNKSDQHYYDLFINNKLKIDEQFDYLRKNVGMLMYQVAIFQLTRGYLGISLMSLIKHTQSRTLRTLYLFSSPLSLFGKIIIKHKKNNK